MKFKIVINRIKKHESFVPTVYNDSLDIPTIGYGFAIKDLVLTKKMSEEILSTKVIEIHNKLMNKYDWYKSMPEVIKEVIIEMCYQVGVEGFSKFKKTIIHFRLNNWTLASDEMLNSRWASQTPKRAKELSELVRSLRKGRRPNEQKREVYLKSKT